MGNLNILAVFAVLFVTKTAGVLGQQEEGQLYEDGSHINDIVDWVLKFREMSTFSEICKKFDKAAGKEELTEEALKQVNI